MTAADQIAEINRQYDERVKLLQAEREAKIALVRGRCAHSVAIKEHFPHGVALTCADCGIDIVSMTFKQSTRR